MKCNGIYLIVVQTRLAYNCASSGIPEAQRLVTPSRRDQSTIRTKGHAQRRRTVLYLLD
jgi:hypothetical protein